MTLGCVQNPPCTEERTDFKQIIIITGTPGVGKTTISERLAARLGASHINLADLVKRGKLTSGYDRHRRTWIADTRRLADRLKQMTAEQGNFVVDGHYAPAVIPKARVTKIFVLRRHPEQLKEQLEKRGYRGAKLWENLAAEALDVCLHDAIVDAGVDKVCEIDTTDKDTHEIIKEIISILTEKATCSAGTVDWLGKLEQEGKLDEYLRHF